MSRRPGGGALAWSPGGASAEGSDGTDGRWRIARRRRGQGDRPWTRCRPPQPPRPQRRYRAPGRRPQTGIPDEKLTRPPGPRPDPPRGGVRPPGPGAARRRRGTGRVRPGGQGDPVLPRRAAGRTARAAGVRPDAAATTVRPLPGTATRPTARGPARRDRRRRAQAVISPPLQAPVPGGLTVDNFTVDEQAGTVTAGRAPVTLSRTRTPPSASPAGTARCAPGAPPARPAAARPHERDALLRAARADWAGDTGLREDYCTPAQRGTGRRPGGHLPGPPPQLRYRGVAKNHAWPSAAPPR